MPHVVCSFVLQPEWTATRIVPAWISRNNEQKIEIQVKMEK